MGFQKHDTNRFPISKRLTSTQKTTIGIFFLTSRTLRTHTIRTFLTRVVQKKLLVQKKKKCNTDVAATQTYQQQQNRKQERKKTKKKFKTLPPSTPVRKREQRRKKKKRRNKTQNEKMSSVLEPAFVAFQDHNTCKWGVQQPKKKTPQLHEKNAARKNTKIFAPQKNTFFSHFFFHF